MLVAPERIPERNGVWEILTPNEVYKNRRQSYQHLKLYYRKHVDKWARDRNIFGKKVWVEMRLQAPSVITAGNKDWWRERMFGDAIFWVFQRPEQFVVRGVPRFFYFLEYYECQRVAQALWRKYGHWPFPRKDDLSLYVPADCMEHVWNERSGGYSDHIRHRPDFGPTLEQQERIGRQREEVEQVKKNIVDLTNEQADAAIGSSGSVVESDFS